MIFAVLAGCAGGSNDLPHWHADVRPIVEGRCAGCHTEGAIAPFPLVDYASVSAMGEIVKEVTSSGQMPPWGAVPGHLDYAGDRSLTDAQIETIAAWVDGGMPEGDPEDAGPPLPSLEVALPRVDASLVLPEAYAPAEGLDDDYRCFPVEWSLSGTQYVTGFDVHPDNATIVHHVAAFLIRPDGIAGDPRPTFLEWDDTEAGPGYTCFGGPSKSGESLDVPIQQVAQWVPGSGATLFPDGVGIEIPEGSLVVVQMHYNTLSGDGKADQTSLDLMVEPEVTRKGAFAPWLDAAWTCGGMPIGAGAEGVVHNVTGDPLPFFEILLGAGIDLSNGFDIHAAMLHMHTLGRHGVVTQHRADGDQVLLEVADWDFDWQLNYTFAAPVAFTPGDELDLSCTFDNPTDVTVNWGEGTGDEMCVANLFVSAPK